MDISFSELGGIIAKGQGPRRGMVIFYNEGAKRRSKAQKAVDDAAAELAEKDGVTVYRVPLPPPDSPMFTAMFPFRTTPTCALATRSSLSKAYISGARTADELRAWMAVAPTGAICKEEDDVKDVISYVTRVAGGWIDGFCKTTN